MHSLAKVLAESAKTPPAGRRTVSGGRTARSSPEQAGAAPASHGALVTDPAALAAFLRPVEKPLQDVVLVGTGPLARRSYFPALQALQRANALIVRAIVDPTDQRSDAAGEAFPDALRVGSIEAMIALPQALAIVATSSRFHLAQATAALKRGWHVLCASPLAPTAHEATLIIAAAQRHQRLLAVDLRARNYPAARYLRTLCQDHLLGPPLSFRVQCGETSLIATERGAAAKVEPPDGALTALGLPSLELLTWCFGEAAIVRYADDAMGGVEANALLELSFRDGVRGTVQLSRDWPLEDLGVFVFERGIVRWSGNRVNAVTLQLASAPFAVAGELAGPLTTHDVNFAPVVATEDLACIAQLENLLAAIAGREVLRTPATEAMHALPLIEACYAQRSPLEQPWLSRNDAAHARALSPPAALHRS